MNGRFGWTALTRLLGVDLGEQRIGLAVADSNSGSVRPLATIRRGDRARTRERLRSVCEEQRIDELVVGLPLNMDGTEGAQAAITREWAAAVEDAVGRPIVWRDERLDERGGRVTSIGPRAARLVRRPAFRRVRGTRAVPGSIAKRPRPSSRPSSTRAAQRTDGISTADPRPDVGTPRSAGERRPAQARTEARSATTKCAAVAFDRVSTNRGGRPLESSWPRSAWS